MSVRKVPQRTCIGCGKTTDKRELLRIVRTPSGEVIADASSKLSGRGAYICRSKECFSKASKGNKLSRALEVDIPQDVLEKLSAQFTGDDE